MAATPPPPGGARTAAGSVRPRRPRRRRPQWPVRQLVASAALVLVAALGPRALADDPDGGDVLVSSLEARADSSAEQPPAVAADDGGGDGPTLADVPEQGWRLWLQVSSVEGEGDTGGGGALQAPARAPAQPGPDGGARTVAADPLGQAAPGQQPGVGQGCDGPAAARTSQSPPTPSLPPQPRPAAVDCPVLDRRAGRRGRRSTRA